MVGVRFYSQALSFYLRQPVYLFQVQGELEFGLSLRPEAGWVLRTWKDVAHLALRQRQVLFLVRRQDLPELKARLPGSWQEAGRFKDCLFMGYTTQ